MAAMDDAVAGEPVDRGGHDREAHLHRGHAPAARPCARAPPDRRARWTLEKRSHELLRAAHRLAEQDARHRQRLLDQRRHVCQATLTHRLDAPALVAHAARQPHEERQQAQREQRQLPTQREHRHDRGEDRGDGGHGRGGGARHHVVDPADVVGDPRLHLSRAGTREERQRHALQVGEDGGAQVVHHALADLVCDPRLRHADHAIDDRQRDHPADQPRQQRQIALLEALVDRFAQQERRGDAEDRAEEDQRQQGPQTQPVGDEQPCNAPQRHRPVGVVLGAWWAETPILRSGGHCRRHRAPGRRAGCSHWVDFSRRES